MCQALLGMVDIMIDENKDDLYFYRINSAVEEAVT